MYLQAKRLQTRAAPSTSAADAFLSNPLQNTRVEKGAVLTLGLPSNLPVFLAFPFTLKCFLVDLFH